MLFIPFEQFCKYYNLLPRTLSSRIKYEIRHFFGIWRLVKSMFSAQGKTPHRS
jgi:hypothetical protein